MPRLIHSIGDKDLPEFRYHFMQMKGSPFLRQQDFEIIQRAGVNGSGVRRLGERGKPFQIQTMNYEASHSAAAAAKLREYHLLHGSDPQLLTRNGVDQGTYVILAIVEDACFAIHNSTGGLVGGEECCQIITWTLLG